MEGRRKRRKGSTGITGKCVDEWGLGLSDICHMHTRLLIILFKQTKNVMKIDEWQHLRKMVNEWQNWKYIKNIEKYEYNKVDMTNGKFVVFLVLSN
jgi:hypothetical protein